MKYGLLLILILYWFNNHSTVHTKICVNSIYEPGDDLKLYKKYESEWGIIGYLHRKIYSGSTCEFNELSTEAKQKLCACVFIKRNPDHAHIKDFFTLIDARAYTFDLLIDTNIFWNPFKGIPETISCLRCSYDEKIIYLAKSYRKKLYSQPQWDIYVLNVDVQGRKTFEGIIKNMDLEVDIKPEDRKKEVVNYVTKKLDMTGRS